MMIEGEYNTADVKADSGEDGALEQIEEMVNHEAFTGDENVAIMPDFHWGAGAVIGFTMPLGNRVSPSTVGVDIGCGMLAVNMGDVDIRGDLELVDREIRDRVPVGFNVHDRNDYHMYDDFPWDICEKKLEQFNENHEWTVEAEYGPDYFDELCRRVGEDQGYVINGIGTLGGGNHFIELGYAQQSSDLWTIIHSGSRKIGLSTAQYWIGRATDYTTSRQTFDEVPEDARPYLTTEWKPDADAIRADFNGKDIQNMFDQISRIIQKYGPSSSNRNTDLDYLEGEEAHGYIRDMVFAQTYASESRRQMSIGVLKATEEVVGTSVVSEDEIESVHNYIDFEDTTIRKGACRAHDGERVIIPFNLKYGTLICSGKGDPSWNNSAPHGAGRAMGRRDAKREFNDEDFEEQTDGVYTSKEPIDEIPGAYKDPDMIEGDIGPTVGIIDRIVPVLNLKAE